MHGARPRRCASATISTTAKSPRLIPTSSFVDARHRADRGGGDGALAPAAGSGRHRHRHRAARCAPSPTNCRRWSARSTVSSRWSAPARSTARPRSTTSSSASRTRCALRHYPMPLPVDRALGRRSAICLMSLPSVRNVLSLVEQADVDFRRRRLDRRKFAAAQGRLHHAEAERSPASRRRGRRNHRLGVRRARAPDRQAQLNDRVASAPLRQPTKRLMIGVAMGASRRAPLRAALIGKLISGLITDEIDRGASCCAADDRSSSVNSAITSKLAACLLRRSNDSGLTFWRVSSEYSPAGRQLLTYERGPAIGGNTHDDFVRSLLGACALTTLSALRLRRYDADDRHRQQRRHDPHAGADGRFHQGQSRHQTQLGHARRERAAPEGDDRHRHQGRTVRRADHRHLRNADLGQEGLARSARQARRRLRRQRPAARPSAPPSPTTASCTPRRSTARARCPCIAPT